MTVGTIFSTLRVVKLCTMWLLWGLCMIVSITSRDFTMHTQMTSFVCVSTLSGMWSPLDRYQVTLFWLIVSGMKYSYNFNNRFWTPLSLLHQEKKFFENPLLSCNVDFPIQKKFHVEHCFGLGRGGGKYLKSIVTNCFLLGWT